MEDTTETPHPDYLKGFNEGYTMGKHMPEVTESLAKALQNSERDSGFKDGNNQYILEKKQERYPKWLRSDRMNNTPDREPDRGEKDKEKE